MSLHLNTKTVTGSGSASLWQADKQRDWLTWEQNVALQQQQQQQQVELKSEEVNGAQDQKAKRGAALLGAKTKLDPSGTLCTCVCVECVCMCGGMCVFVSVHKSCACFLLPLCNYPINLNLSSGTSSQGKSNESLYGAGVGLCDLRKFLCVYLFVRCVYISECLYVVPPGSAVHIDKILH